MVKKKGRRRQECNRKLVGRKAGARRGESGQGGARRERRRGGGPKDGGRQQGTPLPHPTPDIPHGPPHAPSTSALGVWRKAGSAFGQGGREMTAGNHPPSEPWPPSTSQRVCSEKQPCSTDGYKYIHIYIAAGSAGVGLRLVRLLPSTAPGELEEAQPGQPSPFPPSPKLCPCRLSPSQNKVTQRGSLCLPSSGEREDFRLSGSLGKPSWPPTAISICSSLC